MAYFWREPVGLLSAHREYEKFFLSFVCLMVYRILTDCVQSMGNL